MLSAVVKVLGAGCVLTGLLAACGPSATVVYTGDDSVESADDAGLISGDGGPSAMPSLAKIDPGGTIMQTPGQGVGVFTEYTTGGHWYVFWTCDTELSNDSCPFAIDGSVGSGPLTNAKAEGFGPNDSLVLGGAEGGADSTSFAATAVSTTGVQGVRFDTNPGEVITLSAALGGEYSGSFLFYVQDGQVNGGYTGTLTDPLELQATSP